MAGRWPEGADSDLRQHAACCQTCGAAAELASALATERNSACSEAVVPPSAVVWWRADMRARQQAVRQATRPISAVTALAMACAAGIIAAIVPLGRAWLRPWIDWFGGSLQSLKQFPLPALPVPALPDLAAGFTSASMSLPFAVVVAVAAWLIVTPLVLYFTLSD